MLLTFLPNSLQTWPTCWKASKSSPGLDPTLTHNARKIQKVSANEISSQPKNEMNSLAGHQSPPMDLQGLSNKSPTHGPSSVARDVSEQARSWWIITLKPLKVGFLQHSNLVWLSHSLPMICCRLWWVSLTCHLSVSQAVDADGADGNSRKVNVPNTQFKGRRMD